MISLTQELDLSNKIINQVEHYHLFDTYDILKFYPDYNNQSFTGVFDSCNALFDFFNNEFKVVPNQSNSIEVRTIERTFNDKNIGVTYANVLLLAGAFFKHKGYNVELDVNSQYIASLKINLKDGHVLFYPHNNNCNSKLMLCSIARRA